MRLVIFLLAVANLLFFAWTRGVFGEGAQGNPRAGEPLRAEQIRLLSNDRPPQESAEKEKEKPPPEPAKAATDTPVENDRCVVLSDVPQAEADALERRFAEALPSFALTRTAMPGNSSFWINISPFKTRREAESKVEELKKLGIKDYFIMQEGNADSFAVSLGLYSSRDAADTALAALKDKGARSARLTERPRKSSLAKIELRGPEAKADEMRVALGNMASKIKTIACNGAGR